jgi:hypothetical protein
MSSMAMITHPRACPERPRTTQRIPPGGAEQVFTLEAGLALGTMRVADDDAP